MQGDKPVCNGAIISPHYVLTTSVCAGLPRVDAVRAGFGRLRLPGNEHTVAKRIVFHETEEEDNHLGAKHHNVALIRVKRPFKFDETRQPIRLFEAGEKIRAGTEAVVTGWGWTKWTMDKPTERLQSLAVRVVDQQSCDETYWDRGLDGVHDGKMCARAEAEKCVAIGDYGGPLVVDGRLAGLWCGGNGCGDPGLPAVYTDVMHYREWIDKHAVELSDLQDDEEISNWLDHVEL